MIEKDWIIVTIIVILALGSIYSIMHLGNPLLGLGLLIMAAALFPGLQVESVN